MYLVHVNGSDLYLLQVRRVFIRMSRAESHLVEEREVVGDAMRSRQHPARSDEGPSASRHSVNGTHQTC